MQIEIVTHCMHYSRLLVYQLSSLVRWPPQTHTVRYTLCFCPDDIETFRLATSFGEQRVEGITWNWMSMPASQVNRRGIGRNRAARATTADWVWFTDADYSFGEGCLDALGEEAALRSGPLLFPRFISGTEHDEGDRLIADAGSSTYLVPPFESFTRRRRYRRAIGGMQIARGSVCREKGYVPDVRRWQRPAATFQRCREDVAFRRSLGTRGCGIDLPNVYRISHTAKGRCGERVDP